MNLPPKISVVIPALQDTTALQNLVRQLLQQNVFEIIIIQSDQVANPFAESPHYHLLTASLGRGPQIQTGLNAAKGNIIWILHADNELPQEAVTIVKTIMETPENIMGCFPLAFNVGHPALRFFAWMSRIESGLTTFGDQGFFFRSNARILLPTLLDYPLLEDVIIRRNLKRKGRIKKANQPLITDARRFISYGAWRTQCRNGWILLRFLCGTSPKKLYGEYYGNY